MSMPQEVPFKAEGHRITYPLQKSIISLLEKGFTLKDVSELLDVNPSLVKDIDKKRLESKFKDKPPECYSRHIGIDEFFLHTHTLDMLRWLRILILVMCCSVKKGRRRNRYTISSIRWGLTG